jgi:GTP-binding protein HflX
MEWKMSEQNEVRGDFDMRSARERAILIAVRSPGGTDGTALDERLEELALLCNTAGVDVVGRVVQARERLDAATYIGRGKVEALAALVKERKADVAVFEGALSPSQATNLEKALASKVLDRSAVILDIFARRARTREAKVQVELAQLEYLYPRLTRLWGHLSRQEGGIGTRGPGERQLEVDRRAVRKRIEGLRRALKRVEGRREIARHGREGCFCAALVGYTNAGKSTLLSALADRDDVFIEGRLFATLDATTRIAWVPGQRKALLSDTVGFIRDLPPHLVASFRSTLEEVREADLLLHVVDASHSAAPQQMATTDATLEDLGVAGHPTLTVLNKTDRLAPDAPVLNDLAEGRRVVPVSAIRGTGLEALRWAIAGALDAESVELDLRIPQREGALVAALHGVGDVLAVSYEGQDVLVTARLQRGRAEALRLSRWTTGSRTVREGVVMSGVGDAN